MNTSGYGDIINITFLNYASGRSDDTTTQCSFIVGDNCDGIKYHSPAGEGDAHYCDVYMGNRVERIFKPLSIMWESESR